MNNQQSPQPISPAHTHNSKKHSGASEIVLQWVTYVFWFWTLSITSVMIGANFTYFIGSNNGAEWVAFLIGPLLVLYIAGLLSDRYYRRVEPTKKHGFSAVIMVLNAVIACLVGVSALITALIALTTIVIDSGGSEGAVITALTSLVIALFSFLFFFRISYATKLRLIHTYFWAISGGIVLVTLALAAAGPLTSRIERRNDVLIENNYFTIRRAINEHARDNNRLPERLSDVTFEDDAKKAIDTGRITYSKDVANADALTQTFNDRSQELQYELCVDWDGPKDLGYSYDRTTSRSYFGGAHGEGRECYEESVYLY